MDKAPDAFRTISEVADDLDIPQHVLRFWETRFAQIKPMKRSGGRRFYRPDDVSLLRGIRGLLYGEGYTIRGVQKILKEHGVKAVQALADGAPLSPKPSFGASERGPERAEAVADPAGRDDLLDTHDEDGDAGDDHDEIFDDADTDGDDGQDARQDSRRDDRGDNPAPVAQRGNERSQTSPLQEPRFGAPGFQSARPQPSHAQEPHGRSVNQPAPVAAPVVVIQGLDDKSRAALESALDDLLACREILDAAHKAPSGSNLGGSNPGG